MPRDYRVSLDDILAEASPIEKPDDVRSHYYLLKDLQLKFGIGVLGYLLKVDSGFHPEQTVAVCEAQKCPQRRVVQNDRIFLGRHDHPVDEGRRPA